MGEYWLKCGYKENGELVCVRAITDSKPSEPFFYTENGEYKEVINPRVIKITKEVFENLEDFKSLHPAYQVLTKENMLKGLSVPIHIGALKYYKEVSLDKYIDPKLIIN